MNLTWHIVRKDLRRFWLPLSLLCAVTIIRFGVGISLLATDAVDAEWFWQKAAYANVLLGVGLFVTYMLAAGVIHEDSVATSAFWQTRPISGSRLLAAKALGLVLMFGILPVLLSIPWWLGCSFGWPEILRAASETFLIQMAVVALALPWACVTGNYGRFLLWTVVAAVAWVSVAVMLLGHAISPGESVSPWVGATRLLVIALVAYAGSLAVAVHQFTTRRTARSVALIVLAALAMAGVGRWLKWDGAAIWSPRLTAPSGVAADMKITYQGASAYQLSEVYNTVADVTLVADPVPPHQVLSLLYSDQSLRWADGSVSRDAHFELWGWHLPMSTWSAYDQLRIAPGAPDRSWRQYMERRNLARIPAWDSSGKAEATQTLRIILPPETTKRLLHEAPEYHGTYGFRLLRPEVVGEREAQVGSVFSAGSSYARVASETVDESRQIMWLSFVERHPGYVWTDLLSSLALRAWSPEPVYGVVDARRTYARDGVNATSYRALIGNVAIVMRRDSFRGREQWNPASHTWETRPNSFDGTKLVQVSFEETGRFSLAASVARFTVSTYEKPPRGGSCTVTGEVIKPGSFELFRGTTLVNALRDAGGVSDRADLGAVVITRAGPSGRPDRIVVNVEAWLQGKGSEGESPVLQPGDVVDVPISKSPQPQ